MRWKKERRNGEEEGGGGGIEENVWTFTKKKCDVNKEDLVRGT